MVRIERNIENESCSTTWVEPKKVFKSYPDPENSPLWPPKAKMTPKSKSNVRIEGNLGNESCSTTWVDSETIVEPYSNPQTHSLGLQKDKNDPKIKSNSNVKIKKTKKMKFVQLHE